MFLGPKKGRHLGDAHHSMMELGQARAPQPPARCRCGGNEFEFLGLQKGGCRGGSRTALAIPLWNCKTCKTTRIGPCGHEQRFLLEIKDGREVWGCWICGISLSVPHKFKSSPENVEAYCRA